MIDLAGTFGLPPSPAITVLEELLEKAEREHRFCSVLSKASRRIKALKPLSERDRPWFEDAVRSDLLSKMERLDEELSPLCRDPGSGFSRNVASIWLAECSGVSRWGSMRGNPNHNHNDENT